MTLTRKNTGVVMGILLGLAFVYEGLSLAYGVQATISELFWSMSSNPLVPFLLGVLCGHFVWQRSTCVNCGKSPIWKGR